jgi:hypothetical protein
MDNEDEALHQMADLRRSWQLLRRVEIEEILMVGEDNKSYK